ncbi:hypothetical protein [Streptosporangium sp. NPDC049376]
MWTRRVDARSGLGGQAALGGEKFAAAYAKGWELDARTAVSVADPASGV